MTLRSPAIGAIAVLFLVGVGTSVSRAQGPMFDRANVNLPYAITIGDQTLPPGDYTFQELQSNAKSTVLLIYGDHGKSYKADVLTIPTMNNLAPDKTRLVLHHFGQDYYPYKLWISGRDYGYEFLTPEKVKEREQETTASLTANYTAPAAPAAAPPPPPPPPAPEAAPPEAPAPAPPAPEAERAMPAQLPKTGSNEPAMLLAGLVFAGLGLLSLRLGRHA